jgi:hypothetical protein
MGHTGQANPKVEIIILFFKYVDLEENIAHNITANIFSFEITAIWEIHAKQKSLLSGLWFYVINKQTNQNYKSRFPHSVSWLRWRMKLGFVVQGQFYL